MCDRAEDCNVGIAVGFDKTEPDKIISSVIVIKTEPICATEIKSKQEMKRKL